MAAPHWHVTTASRPEGTRGSSRRRRRAARIPSSSSFGGMRMSVSTTSGFSASTAPSSPSRSPQVATTSSSGSVSSSRRIPSRTRKLSSARTRRIATPPRIRLVAGHRGAQGVGSQDLGGAFLVEDVDFGDREAGDRQQVRNQPAEGDSRRTGASGSARSGAASRGCARPVCPQRCSTKCSVPPGLSTRRSSARAATLSGIVHIVHVESAASKLLSSKGSDWPSKPDRSTGTPLPLQSFVGELPGQVGRFDRGNSGHGRRVERDVQSRAEADLDDVAL